MQAMGRWTTFTATDQFAYDTKAVKRQWARLHACDQEAPPDAPELLQAWTLFHNGHFEEAHRDGLRLGEAGLTVANKAACIYAAHLEPLESERLALYQQVSARAEAHIQSQPDNANAHYLLAYSLGRYSQGISVAQALAQGLGSKIKTALETTIALQPRHADAHFALGAFHAEIIDKVGPMIGFMTYGAKKGVSLEMFEQGFTLQPRSPTGLLEYAAALLMLEGDMRREQATAIYRQAAALQAMDAREYLDIAAAKGGIEG
jgi:tetratricopeptide (TPR) repeat protein